MLVPHPPSQLLVMLNMYAMVLALFQVKDHLWLFVNCLIENPTFDSQTKENMTLQSKSFGSKAVLSDKFIAQVSASPD